MRKGLTLSILLHFWIGLFVMLELPEFVMPEKEITQINVKLVSAPKDANSKKTKVKQPPKKVKTQASAAPKKATKKKVEKKIKKTKSKTKVVQKKKAKSKKVVKKKETPKQEKQVKKKLEENKKNWRPEKLDKTPDKVIKKDKSKKAKTVEKADDFLDALDFIDELEKEQKQSKKIKEAEIEDEYSIYDIDQIAISRIKRAIQSNWYKTAGANKQKKLVTIVRLSLDRDGSVRKVKIVKSSGASYFDRSLERAIRKSSPLPIPLDKFEIYKTIELRFKG